MEKTINTERVFVGIPTCWGGVSLLKTVKSIYTSKGDYDIVCYIVADRTPIPKELWNEIESTGAKIFWNEKQSSQPAKINQLLAMCNEEIFISTQDDVIFDEHTIPEIIKAFKEDDRVTIVASVIKTLPPLTVKEGLMRGIVNIPVRIALWWNDGDNFLSASGRCMSFRTAAIKKYEKPEYVVNGDMFYYLEDKRLGGKFVLAKRSFAYIRVPETIKDQIGPASRFQYSQVELEKHFGREIAKEYHVPLNLLIKAFAIEWLVHPIATTYYLWVYTYTRLFPQPITRVANPLWDMDPSTKRV